MGEIVSYRKRRKNIFDLFDLFFKDMEEVVDEFFKEFEKFSEFPEEKGFRRTGPFVYGFRITIGPDGKPKIEEFGNVRRERGTSKIMEEIEPLVDILDEGDKLRVVVEVPGVEKDKIKLRAKGKTLIIDAENGKKYYKEIQLPEEVDIKTAKAQYRNGVLEVELKKSKKSREEFEIKVE